MILAMFRALAQELLALFGFLCFLFYILLPVLIFVLRSVAIDMPCEWRKWQLHRAQQHELRRLRRRIEILTRRKQAVGKLLKNIDYEGVLILIAIISC
ncbi:hypothetical protein CCR75_001225 [Bremia lactucae]|uniref:Uncharacterized protein n=1 Tax=Bremia lactucae TaxID=4779 RepID=A0A976FQQ9_BRELC|nr:hypothetical protein CCR75_001225 [Bremia lactucae]